MRSVCRRKMRVAHLRVREVHWRLMRGVYDTAVQRGGWSCSTVVLQLRLHG
jgi:hypothetical protein